MKCLRYGLRRYCEKAVDVVNESRLTVDPSEAHEKQIQRYELYKEYMKDAFTPDRSLRRKELLATIPEEELARRSVAYGIWMEALPPLNPANRWEGILGESKLPARYRNFKTRTLRLAHALWGVFVGYMIFYFIFFSDYSYAVQHFMYKDVYNQLLFEELYGHTRENWILPSELVRPPQLSLSPIEGEPPHEDPVPSIIRWSAIKYDIQSYFTPRGEQES